MVRFASKIGEHIVDQGVNILGADSLELLQPGVKMASPDQYLPTWAIMRECALRDPATKETNAQAAIARRCPEAEPGIEIEANSHLVKGC